MRMRTVLRPHEGCQPPAVGIATGIEGVEVDAGEGRNKRHVIQVEDGNVASRFGGQLDGRCRVAEGAVTEPIPVGALARYQPGARAHFEHVDRLPTGSSRHQMEAEPQSERPLHVVGLHQPGMQQLPDLVRPSNRIACTAPKIAKVAPCPGRACAAKWTRKASSATTPDNLR